MKRTSTIAALLLVATILMIGFEGNFRVKAAVGQGIVTIAFDDGIQNLYDNAFPLLQQYGIHATFYIITSEISNFSGDNGFMSIDELQTLQNSGSEIGSHSVTHPDFPSLTDSQIVAECVNSKQLLQSYGLTANNFAYPYGDTNNHVDSIVSQYYRSGRSAYQQPYLMSYPTTQFRLQAYDVESWNISQASQYQCLQGGEAEIDQVVSTNSWGIFFFHNIIPNDFNDVDEMEQGYFADFLAYAKASGAQILTVNQALDIAGPPLSASITPTSMNLTVGHSQLFSSNVTGGVSPYAYQWNLNGTAVSGANNSTWNFTPSSTGTYNINLNVVDSYAGNVQTNTAKVTVKPPPNVTISPTQARMTLGQQLTFNSSVAGGFTPYTCQWYLNGTAIPGCNDSSWVFTPAQTGHFTVYLNATDNQNNHAQSNIVNDIIVSSQLLVSITPAASNMTVGGSLQINSTVAGGFIPYAYQWYLNNSAISYATSPTCMFTPNSIGTYNINLNVTDVFNNKTQSNTANITVYSQPTVTITPTSVNMTIGGTQKFNSTVTGGLVPYTYQWYYANGTSIAGATASNIAYKANFTGTYSIYLNVTDSLNNRIQSNSATLNVNSQPTATITPVAVNMTVGALQTFNSTVSGGTPPYSYQWYVNGSQVSGATGGTWIYNATSAGTYLVFLRITDNYNITAQSNNATVKVETPMNVTVIPGQVKMYVAQSLTFNSSISGGTLPFSYQWYLNGTTVTGATGASWTFTPRSAGDFKVYVRVTDGFNFSVNSNVTDVLVCSINLMLTPASAQSSFGKGQSATFTVDVFNQNDPSFASSLTLTISGPSNYGYFDVQPVNVLAGGVKEYSFDWVAPSVGGTYVVEVGLAPAQLTAYDQLWLNVS